MRFCLVVLHLFASLSLAQATDLGTTGLIDTPTARMQADGTFSASIADQTSSNIYSLTYQATPWIEATFRYAIFRDAFEYYDRSYEVKLRLLEEGKFLPELAVGVRDAVGTGIFGAEYIVGSKSFGNLDVSLGLGWGRLAGKSNLKNPLIGISDQFRQRDQDFGQGGEISSGIFFRGENVGPFGGLSYKHDRLKFMLEYNPDQYDWEVARGMKRFDKALSYGLSWQVNDDISLTLSHQHGEEVGLRLTARLNTKALPPAYPPAPFISAVDLAEQDLPSGMRKDQWYDMLLYDMERSGLYLIDADYEKRGSHVRLTISNKDYPIWADAVAKSLSLADAHLPKRFKTISLVIQENNMQVHTLETIRPSLLPPNDRKRFASQLDIGPAVANETPKHRTNFVKKKVVLDVSLQNRLQFFDPDDPLRYQFYALIGASVPLPGGIYLNAGYAQDIVNNFDTIIRESDSTLPHVRSDMKKYYQQGESGVDNLFLEKYGSGFKYLHYRVFGGILEEMFSGVGADFVYIPPASRLGFGASLAYARQRDYDRGFDHLDYDTVTGFLSGYWATPFYNYDLALHAGRYLARDWGATMELRRTFENGWAIGLWATLTDVPFETFGEGSFDKGMYFKVPLAPFLGQNVRSNYVSRLRPIQRDGGARLEGYMGNLWHQLRGVRYDAFDVNRERMRP